MSNNESADDDITQGGVDLMWLSHVISKLPNDRHFVETVIIPLSHFTDAEFQIVRLNSMHLGEELQSFAQQLTNKLLATPSAEIALALPNRRYAVQYLGRILGIMFDANPEWSARLIKFNAEGAMFQFGSTDIRSIQSLSRHENDSGKLRGVQAKTWYIILIDDRPISSVPDWKNAVVRPYMQTAREILEREILGVTTDTAKNASTESVAAPAVSSTQEL